MGLSRTDKIEKISQKLFVRSQDRFINREISWLAFNMRVLDEAMNPNTPLLERVQFLSISASNLDEFFMVRVAGLKDQLRNGINKRSDDGLAPDEQLEKIYEMSDLLMHRQQECWQELLTSLDKEGIHIVSTKKANDRDRRLLAQHFNDEIFPILTPIAIDPAHPFPFMPNLGKALLLHMRTAQNREVVAVIPRPPKLRRFIKLPARRGQYRFAMLEEVVLDNLDSLFPGAKIIDTGMISIVRDSDLEIEEDAEDLVGVFEKAVKRRRRGRVIRLKASNDMSDSLLNFVVDQLQVREEEVSRVGVLGITTLRELLQCERPELKYSPFKARFPERISDYGGDCFAAICAKDIVVHHPFETFDVVVQFLRQAAADPNVIAIKQTLYRTSNDSPIVKALVEAAEAGKAVTVIVELKARFDEEANIKWARDLESAGAQVIYGFVNYKTHAKISMVVRRDGKKLRSYVHFGTGNYHPNTARVYTDLSFFTCDPILCSEASRVFNYLTGYAPPKAFKELSTSPLAMRRDLLGLIEQEVKHVRAGRQGQIWAKMNALVDAEMIDALYYASQEGVKIDLIVRGICCLRPQVPGLSENIRVKSVIGRFLEHSRIFCFGNGHGLPSQQAQVYISSADWMPRNLNGRVEVMVPINNPTVHEQILEQIMVALMRDERQSWVLDAEGVYTRITNDKEAFSAHEYFLHNPSLSGRGKALSRQTAPEIPASSRMVSAPKDSDKKKDT
ncbi:MAG: RNA degradosome polyphosphate kinase [Alphaproteobacteria bacterium]|nr:RNA degradosome polyphosphate kinase [Alphaproteobacteria bacterium]